MSFKNHFKSAFRNALALLMVFCCFNACAQELTAIIGQWKINPQLSDNTDKEVGRVLRKMGTKVGRCWFNCEEDRFRGGPEEQELYDRISYDKSLVIELDAQSYKFTYDDNYLRPVYTDGRSQSVSLTGLDELKDFSFAHWEGNLLLVEGRPRDGGFANETYSLIEGGSRLKADLYIHPAGFTEPIELVRIYDRIPDSPAQ